MIVGKKWWIVMGVALLVIAILAVYFTFFFTKTCRDQDCFNSALVKCQKAKYIDDRDDAAWDYKIVGKDDGKCNVRVLLLQLKQGTTTMKTMENKEMNCYLPLKIIMVPQSNIDNCHGILKEEMQKIMINKLFAYITSNVGSISEELRETI